MGSLSDLLEKVKRYLKITWSDEDEDINDIIKRGQSYLNGKSGSTLDFGIDLEAQQLLLDYCRYVYNHSFELFEHNFHSQILSLSLREGVKDHATSETDTETSA